MAVKKATAGEAPKVSRWAQLKAEAKKDYTPIPPYEFDAFDPPVLISAPDTLERSLALATLTDMGGGVKVEDLRSLIEALVGDDAFIPVWTAVKDEPIEVVLALVDELNEHFSSGNAESAAGLPGKA